MTKIKGSKLDLAITVDAVGAWFTQRVGFDCPVDIDLFRIEASKVGVNWLGLFCMAIVETAYFRSEIFKSKRNMFGLGAVDSDPVGGAETFKSDQIAIRAGAEHLAVYAGAPGFDVKPEKEFVLKRSAQIRSWGYFGIVEHFADLGGETADSKVKWASNPEHGAQIEELITEIFAFAQIEKLITEIFAFCKANAEPVTPPKSSLPKESFWTVVIVALKHIQPILAKVNPWLGWIALALYSLLDYLF